MCGPVRSGHRQHVGSRRGALCRRIGGARRIGRFCERIVPLTTVLYGRGDLDKKLQKKLGVPDLDCPPCALIIAVVLVKYATATSRARRYNPDYRAVKITRTTD